MRNLRVICLAMVMAFAVVPAFAATPSTSPAAQCPEDYAIPARVMHDLFTPVTTATTATSSGTNAFGDYFYGYCSQDCTPCYSGNPYPQCAPDIFDGTRQYCLPFRGC
jgi:hypothetical protein